MASEAALCTTWHVEQYRRKKWIRITTLTDTSQKDAEQILFRKYYCQGRLISDDGSITVQVPGGGKDEVEKD